MAASSRETTDGTGPGQRFQQSGSGVTTRGTPARKGVEGNEMADAHAKVAAEDRPPGDQPCPHGPGADLGTRQGEPTAPTAEGRRHTP